MPVLSPGVFLSPTVTAGALDAIVFFSFLLLFGFCIFVFVGLFEKRLERQFLFCLIVSFTMGPKEGVCSESFVGKKPQTTKPQPSDVDEPSRIQVHRLRCDATGYSQRMYVCTIVVVQASNPLGVTRFASKWHMYPTCRIPKAATITQGWTCHSVLILENPRRQAIDPCGLMYGTSCIKTSSQTV